MAEYDFLFKTIIIGETNVGKSCLLLRFLENRFKPALDPTVGVEFASKSLVVGGRHIKLQLWDTAGQESFKSITRSYFRGAIAALVVFDCANATSFEKAQQWIEEVQTASSKNVFIVLAANKSDLLEKRVVSREVIAGFAEEKGIQFFETSAKTGEGVGEVFEALAGGVLAGIQAGRIDAKKELGVKVGRVEQVEERARNKKKECC